MADGIATAEAGLRLAEQQAPQVNTMQAMLYEAASKSLAEGKAAEAAQKIKNPGKVISKENADKRIGQIFKKDSIDNNGNPDQTQEQKDRQKAINNISDAIIHLREKGYSPLPANERKLIHDVLSSSLYNHLTIREIAIRKGINLTGNTFEQFCKLTTDKLLSNQQNGENIANSLVDILEGANINYDELLKNLESKKDLDKVVGDLTTEIGNDGTNNQPKDGLHEEVAKQKENVDKYKTKIVIDPQTNTPTVVPESNDPNAPAKMKLDAELRLKQSDDTVELIQATIKDVDNYFKQHPNATEYQDIIDPENPAQKITIQRGEWVLNKTNWNKKIKAQELLNTKDQQLIDKIKQEETEAKTKLTELENKLKAKKTELDGKKKELDILIKKIDKARDVNEKGTVANLEQELIEDLKRMIVNESLDLWSKGTEEAGKVETDVLKKIEGDITNEAKKRLRDVVYNEQKEKFKKKELNNELSSLLDKKVGGYGMSRLQQLWNVCNAANAPPELKKFAPVIKDIVDFSQQPPKIINQEKLTTFSSEVVGDMLKMVAYKNPRLLENRFTQDEQAMAILKGDILPDLIMQAHKDKSLRSEIEKGFGEKLTKHKIGEAIARWDWKKILWILGILAGIGLLVGGISILKH